MADETWSKRDARIADDARVEAKRQQRIDDARAATKDAWLSRGPVSPSRPPVGPQGNRFLASALHSLYDLAGEPASWRHVPYIEAIQKDPVALSQTVVSDMEDVYELLRRCGRKPRTHQEVDEQRELAWAWVVARYGWQERFSADPR